MSKKNPKNLQRDPHPIKARREQLHISQKLLSDLSKTALPTVQRVEQGLMPTLPYKIWSALYSTKDAPVAEEQSFVHINFRCDDWKSSTRKLNKRYLDWLIENPETWFNWMEFRLQISESKAGFCKLYCVHPHVLDHFEAADKVDKRTKLPDKIRQAFYDAGLSEGELDMIESKLAWGVAGKEMSS